MLKKNKELVKHILKTSPIARDYDNELLADVWESQMSYIDDYDSYDWYGLLELIREGYMASPESIVRVRRKLQEQHPELRGKKWEQRHRAQEVVKEELRNF